MKSVKNQVKSINATSVSSISTIDRYNQYESNQIYRFLSIVIDWLFREIYAIIVRWRSVKTTEQTSVRPFFFVSREVGST